MNSGMAACCDISPPGIRYSRLFADASRPHGRRQAGPPPPTQARGGEPNCRWRRHHRRLQRTACHRSTACSTWLGEAYLLAGRVAAGRQLAQQALDAARAHKQEGWQAYALLLLGDIAREGEGSEVALAIPLYRQALALATLLDLRPLQAHCYRGLSMLYTRIGQQELASAELHAATACYRAMDMVFWLQQDEMAPVQRSGGDEKPHENY